MRMDDYLRRVNQPRRADPAVDTLRRLHLAHRETFLFENLTSQTGRGGYCFEHFTRSSQRSNAHGRGWSCAALSIPPAAARQRGGDGVKALRRSTTGACRMHPRSSRLVGP
jgi:hypothetical protein